METITLSDYLAKNPDSKKIQKRVARAIKTYRHAARDLAHAKEDIAHAKEDCQHAIQMYEVAIEDCQQSFSEWANPEVEEELHLVTGEIEIAEEEEDLDNSDDEDIEDEDGEDEEGEEYEEHPANQGDAHLEHATKDFSNAIEDAESVIEELYKVENLLHDVLEIAEEDGYQIDITDAKSYVVAKAAECSPDSGKNQEG